MLSSTSRPLLVVKAGADLTPAGWLRLFAELAPEVDAVWLDESPSDPSRVAYAFAWAPPLGRLAQFPNLRLIVGDAVGVGHLLRDETLPAVPIVRMGGAELGHRMGEYVCLACLALLRELPRSLANRQAQLWEEFTPDRTACDTRVGILGLGRLGTRAAQMLRGLGFAVAGWSTARKALDGVQSFAGADELPALLRRSDLLVNLLPETPQTRWLLNRETLALLPDGAGVVNVGRGNHLVLPDLIAAIDAGKLCGAVLDVFEPEPLPKNHPAWSHEKLIVTAHGAAYLPARGRARAVAEAIRADLRGAVPDNLYDPAVGY